MGLSESKWASTTNDKTSTKINQPVSSKKLESPKKVFPQKAGLQASRWANNDDDEEEDTMQRSSLKVNQTPKEHHDKKFSKNKVPTSASSTRSSLFDRISSPSASAEKATEPESETSEEEEISEEEKMEEGKRETETETEGERLKSLNGLSEGARSLASRLGLPVKIDQKKENVNKNRQVERNNDRKNRNNDKSREWDRNKSRNERHNERPYDRNHDKNNNNRNHDRSRRNKNNKEEHETEEYDVTKNKYFYKPENATDTLHKLKQEIPLEKLNEEEKQKRIEKALRAYDGSKKLDWADTEEDDFW